MVSQIQSGHMVLIRDGHVVIKNSCSVGITYIYSHVYIYIYIYIYI